MTFWPRIAACMVAVLCLPSGAQACELVQALAGGNSASHVLDNAQCAKYHAASGAAGTSCHWSFAYRSAQAANHADTLWDEITRCKDGQESPPDQTVNHPDSYALRAWNTGAGVFHVSVKDKGAQNRTFVFVRFEAPAKAAQ